MTDDEVLGAMENLPRLQALDDLEAARYGKIRLSPKGYYLVALAAGMDIDTAESMHNAAYNAALKRGERNIETV